MGPSRSFDGMSLYVFVTLCVCVTHDVCVVLGSSLVFLAFCYVVIGRKDYHVYFITTCQSPDLTVKGCEIQPLPLDGKLWTVLQICFESFYQYHQ